MTNEEYIDWQYYRVALLKATRSFTPSSICSCCATVSNHYVSIFASQCGLSREAVLDKMFLRRKHIVSVQATDSPPYPTLYEKMESVYLILEDDGITTTMEWPIL